MGLLLAGLGFKIAAFPFHMWAPDSYEAATTPFVAWLSVAPKTAGFVAIIRVYLEGFGSTAELWMPILATLAGMTIVTGNLMAIPQRNIKRLLAYSGVAHIGYMLIGLAAASSADGRSGSRSVPGSSGSPARCASARAVCLRPKSRICATVGPMNARPARSQASAKSAFSERNP